MRSIILVELELIMVRCFERAIEEGVLPEHSVQVGIRTTNPDTMGVNIIDAPTVHSLSASAILMLF